MVYEFIATTEILYIDVDKCLKGIDCVMTSCFDEEGEKAESIRGKYLWARWDLGVRNDVPCSTGFLIDFPRP